MFEYHFETVDFQFDNGYKESLPTKERGIPLSSSIPAEVKPLQIMRQRLSSPNLVFAKRP